jgi:hypothetical protein
MITVKWSPYIKRRRDITIQAKCVGLWQPDNYDQILVVLVYFFNIADKTLKEVSEFALNLLQKTGQWIKVLLIDLIFRIVQG